MSDAKWDLPELAGRLAELCGCGATAVLTLAVGVVLDAQLRGETVAWVTGRHSHFFPPDVAACGVDLDALPVVRLPHGADIPRAADLLARSSAFGLIVLDLAPGARVPPPLLSRLAGLARKHDTAILCLTEKPSGASSLGPLVSLRGEASRRRAGRDSDGRFACELRVVRDKRRAAGWTHVEVCRGPDGLR